MIPKRMTLRRYRQHDELEIVLTNGMNALRGPNGSGKSHVLEALGLCCGLSVNSEGKNTDAIQDGYERGDVILGFEHAGIEGEIHAKLTRNYTQLWRAQKLSMDHAKAQIAANQLDPRVMVSESEYKLAAFTPREELKFSGSWGDQKWRNATEISAWYRETVGVDTKTVLPNYFPLQGDIDGALSEDETRRQEVFSEKAGTWFCAKIWKELGEQATGIEIAPGLEDALLRSKSTHALAAATVSRVAAELDVLEKSDREPEKYNGVLRANQDAVADRASLGKLLARQTDLQTQRASVSADLAEVKTLGASFRERFDAIQGTRASDLQAIAQATTASQRQAERSRIVGDLSTARTKLAEVSKVIPQDPPSDAELSNMAQLAGEWASKAKSLATWLADWKDGKCPLCGAIVADAERITKTSQELAAARVQEQDLGARRVSLMSAKAQLHAAKTSWQASVATLTARVAQLESTLLGIPEVTVALTPTEVGALQKRVNDIAAVEMNLSQARTRYGILDASRARIEIEREEIDRQIGILSQRVAGAPSDEDVQRASAALMAARENSTRYNEARVEHGIVTGRLADADSALRAATEAVERAGPLKTWKELLANARAMFHREAIPAEVVGWYVSELARFTGTYLEMFEVGYQLVVTSDLSLMAIFPDKAMPAEELSGGEANILNICMRIGMTDLFPSDLRILILDEIEVHMDETNVARLPIFLERVKGLARSRGLMVLFVSHHPSLREIADHVILMKG